MSSDEAATQTSGLVAALPHKDSQLCFQVAVDRAARDHIPPLRQLGSTWSAAEQKRCLLERG
jgi:hypothetical protein